MAKKIKFPLEMDQGTKVRSLEELRDYFSLERVLVYMSNGKLVTWLRDRDIDEIADAIEGLDVNDSEIAQKVCKLFDVEYDDITIDMQKIEKRNRKLNIIKQYTVDKKFLEVVDNVACTQDDIYDLLNEQQNTIYLCGKKFIIPTSREGVTYIGINNPLVKFDLKKGTNINSNNIQVENVIWEEVPSKKSYEDTERYFSKYKREDNAQFKEGEIAEEGNRCNIELNTLFKYDYTIGKKSKIAEDVKEYKEKNEYVIFTENTNGNRCILYSYNLENDKKIKLGIIDYKNVPYENDAFDINDKYILWFGTPTNGSGYKMVYSDYEGTSIKSIDFHDIDVIGFGSYALLKNSLFVLLTPSVRSTDNQLLRIDLTKNNTVYTFDTGKYQSGESQSLIDIKAYGDDLYIYKSNSKSYGIYTVEIYKMNENGSYCKCVYTSEVRYGRFSTAKYIIEYDKKLFMFYENDTNQYEYIIDCFDLQKEYGYEVCKFKAHVISAEFIMEIDNDIINLYEMDMFAELLGNVNKENAKYHLKFTLDGKELK